jgi:hypothetical protein
VSASERARVGALGQSVSVATARQIAELGAAASFAALLIAAVVAFIRRPKGEPARIRAKYGNRLIPIDAADHGSSGAVVDIANIRALATVADGYDGVILHQESGGDHTYLVEVEAVLYRYCSPRGGAEATFRRNLADAYEQQTSWRVT